MADTGMADTGSTIPDTVPDFTSAAFTDPLQIDNPYFPLTAGLTHAYFGETAEGGEIVIVQILDETRPVMGVETRVVRDRVFLEGQIIEDTDDWYAQDDEGNVWYLGEEVDNYDYDDQGVLLEITHEGSWEAGRDVSMTGHVALPGHQMLASPTVGSIYHQEYYLGEAEDAAEVLALDVPVSTSLGIDYSTLQTRDYSTSELTADERKYYASGIGLVLETAADGTEPLEYLGTFDESQPAPDFGAATFTAPTIIDNPLLSWIPGTMLRFESATEDGLEEVRIEVLSSARTVAGIEVVSVRDRVFLDGVIIEDTEDWFAQDDDGNVWYMGEAVDDYNYDDEGVLIDITHEGSWEAGLDIVGIGSLAEPGIAMQADPREGVSYRQEFYEGEAEDMAYVISTDAQIELSDGTVYTGCVETLDWVPLDPAAVETKFYAPGVGLVYSKHVDSPEVLELVETNQ